MRLSLRSRAIAVIVAVFLGLVLLAGDLGAQNTRPDVEQLLDKGLRLALEGDLDGAFNAFSKALTLDPTSDLALEWVDRVGMAKLIRLMEKQPLHTVIGEILRLTHIETKKRSSDSEAVATALAAYFDPDADILEVTRQLSTSVSQHGVYLVPGCVEQLAVPEQAIRVRAMRMLFAISHDAVVPLLRALQSTDAPTVQGVIGSLARINSTAALPSLALLVQTTDDEITRGLATSAIRQIDPEGAAFSGNAYDQLLVQAARFYMNSDYMRLSYHDPVLWILEDNQLKFRTVHAWSVNELRAEQLIEDAFSLDPAGLEGNVLHTCNSTAQYAEYMSTREVYERVGNDEELVTRLKSEELPMQRIRDRSAAQPKSVLLASLVRALDDRRPEVAMQVITAIRDQCSGRRVASAPAELLRAQDYGHRGVRFYAAECVAHMNPSSSFAGADTTIGNLADGLTEAGARIALTIFPEEDDALHVASLLRAAHVVSFNEDTGFLGLQRAMSFPPEDVIVLTDRLEGEFSTATIVRKLRSDARTQDIPILIVVEDDQLQEVQRVYGEHERVVVVNRSVEPARLRDDILGTFFQDDTSARARSIDIASRGASTLRWLAARGNAFDLSIAENGLVTVLENRVDSVRIPACNTVGSLGTERAEAALVRICAEGEGGTASVELYEAALLALGDIVRDRSEISVPTREALENGTASNQPRIIRASARAIGISGVRIRPAVFRELGPPAPGADG